MRHDARWQKVLRDLWTGRGRMALLTAAVAASLFAVGTALSAYAILSRELTRAYLETRPASATLETDAVDPLLVEQVRRQRGIAEADSRATFRARVRVGSDWRPLILFVVPDFLDMRLSTFRHLEGDWPPSRGTLLIEHSGLRIVEARPGQSVIVKTPRGAATELGLSGVVWDSSMAPSGMEQTAWGYVTPDTLAMLGEGDVLDELKIIVAGNPTDAATIEAIAKRLAVWLQSRGHPVHEIQIPPPGRHPHQGQMEAVMLMLNIFSLFALVLSGLLVGSSIASMMARQVREVGVMKAIGATGRQLAGMYLAMMLLLGMGALALAVPLSVAGGKALARTAASNLNIEIASTVIPWWVLAAQCTAGLLLPVLAASMPIARAIRMTVRRAIQDTGTNAEAFGTRRFDGWLSRRRGPNAVLLLGIRNAFRNRARLALTLGLLAAAGAMFMTGINTARSWSLRLTEVNSNRMYDVSIRFESPESAERAVAVARGVAGVSRAEAWGVRSAAWGRTPGVPVVHTYPDKGHGAFQVVGLAANQRVVDLPLLAGRWLRPGDEDVVVLNHMAAAEAQDARVGRFVTISVDGEPHDWRVAGIVRDLGSPATAYVSSDTFARTTKMSGTTLQLGVSTAPRDGAGRADVIRRVERALDDAGLPIDVSMPVETLRTAIDEHMAVLLALILTLAAVMSIVGLLGLTAAMSTGVLERSREIGVMRAIGARPRATLRMVLGEGVMIGALSGVLATAAAVPLSALVGAVIGAMAFRAPLPLVVSPVAALSWLGIVVLFSALATAAPALRASRISVREALAYS